ncbi:IucA/IucC family protein [Microbispora sp. ATCC PTA-5024]|uniref:IucA/IucC family protein n=1 Tax=Microbispora sp. ATCC PTA-5024 TaxID=316330 RepID=UPI0003DC013C|nr:IucA/IucC family protein [Microbispora sp. ATCC PTA-5024]ETK31265.1 iron transporter [Microbispora sp. ATCC PTA-5024]
MDSLLLDPHAAMAEEATLGALLRCCLRELGAAGGRAWSAGPYLLLRLGGSLVRVRARGGIALRAAGPAERLVGGSWAPLTSAALAGLVYEDLRADGGAGNAEFAEQVEASREAVARILAARDPASAPADPWLASEQALVTGHPFHPSPKARSGRDWERYAPEVHARFPLRLLGVRADLVAEEGDTSALDRAALGAVVPPGYVPLPAHPWQVDLLAADLAAPLADGRLLDLGPASGSVVPTSSVRTVYDPATGTCLKFSLDVRITNCVRKNAWYELSGAVELTRRLGPVFDRLAGRFPGTRWLPEPGYRSAALGTRLLEGLGVIVRTGPWEVCGPGVTPVLAAALAAPGGDGVPEAVRARRAADPTGWWRAYVERVARPVLDAFFRHGVVLEAHLQNVLVGIDPGGLPAEAVFRDMEGAKLVAGRHDLGGLPRRVAEGLAYEPGRAWNRVAYCLMVNTLAETAATVAETAGGDEDRLLRELWAVARDVLTRYAEEHAPGPAAPLARVLAGEPLPAKANLGVRWARAADRHAGYVLVDNPFRGV